MQLFAKLKKILRRGFRATLNFRKFKVALVYISIIYRILDCLLYSLNGYDVSFDHMTGESQELTELVNWRGFLENKFAFNDHSFTRLEAVRW